MKSIFGVNNHKNKSLVVESSFKLITLSTICLMLILVSADRSSAAGFTGKYSWSLEGQQVEEAEVLSQSTLTSFAVSADLKNKLTDQFFVHFSPGVFFTSARAQGLILYKRPSNSFFANQAKVSYRPFYALQLQAGAINQGFLKNPLLVSSRAFPSGSSTPKPTKTTSTPTPRALRAICKSPYQKRALPPKLI